jgi:hypothetical protein
MAPALLGEHLRWPDGQTAVKAEISPAERAILVGVPVVTNEGALVGTVSGLSRDTRGHVERIRVTETSHAHQGPRVLIIRDRYFVPMEGAIQLKISMGELDAMPTAMTEDRAGNSGRLF